MDVETFLRLSPAFPHPSLVSLISQATDTGETSNMQFSHGLSSKHVEKENEELFGVSFQKDTNFLDQGPVPL